MAHVRAKQSREVGRRGLPPFSGHRQQQYRGRTRQAALPVALPPCAQCSVLSDAAKWTYLTPLMLGLYAPVLLPSLVLPEEYMSSYSRALAGLGGLQITESLSVDDLNDWFPEEYRRGEHLPPHFRGIYWMDGNGGCEGSGVKLFIR